MKGLNRIIHIKIFVNELYRRHFRIKIFWNSCYFHSFIFSTYSALYYFKGQFRITILPSIMKVFNFWDGVEYDGMSVQGLSIKETKKNLCFISSLIITIKQEQTVLLQVWTSNITLGMPRTCSSVERLGLRQFYQVCHGLKYFKNLQ